MKNFVRVRRTRAFLRFRFKNIDISKYGTCDFDNDNKPKSNWKWKKVKLEVH